MRRSPRILAWLAIAALTTAACAGGGKARPSSADEGSKVLTAVVTDRDYEGPGSSGGGAMSGSGTWYLSLEAQDGDRTVHYHFPVTHQQYSRYPEGTRVRLVLLGDRLRDIRPAND